MPRPKGYRLSEEAKKRIGDAARARWSAKRQAVTPGVLTMEKMGEIYDNQIKYPEVPKELIKKKRWSFKCFMIGHKLEAFLVGSDNYCLRCGELMHP